ncbi:MAG: hypothetical protein V3W41_18105, partial [Planctomycetota bacterium]
GGTYGWSESFVNVVNSPNATGTLKTKQTSCLFSSETVLNQTVNFAETHYTNECLVNEWIGSSSVVWDGQVIPIGGVIDLSQEDLGSHNYIVTRIDGANTEIYDFVITVESAYTSDFMGSAANGLSQPQIPGGPGVSPIVALPIVPMTIPIDYVVPTATVSFTNNTEFAVDIQVVPTALQTGIMVEVMENQAQVQPGDTIVRVIEFGTLPGWVVPAGVPLKAMVNIHAISPFGPVLSSTEVTAASCSLVTGTEEDFIFESTINGGPTQDLCALNATAGDVLVFKMLSPQGAFDGLPAFIVGDIYTPGFPLTRILPAFPEIHVSANYFTVTLFAPLAPGGTSVAVNLPAGLAGFAIRLQGLAVTNTADNGLVACTNAHDIVME